MSYLKEFFKNFDDDNYINWLMRLNNTFQNLFTYENLPTTFNVFFLENYLHLSDMGVCGIINDSKYGIIAVRGNYGGDVNTYGRGTRFIGANCKRSYDIPIDSDNLVMAHNNITMTSDRYLLVKYANLLNEIDKSLNTNIYYSRVYGVPMIEDEKERKQIESVMSSIQKGKTGKVISKNTNLNDLLNKKPFEILKITDGNESVHMDTLIRLRDNILKNFLREIGLNVNTLDKSAQVNNNELQAFITYSNLNLYDYYNERKKFINEVNKKFNTNISIKINENLVKQVLETNSNSNDMEVSDNYDNSGVADNNQ